MKKLSLSYYVLIPSMVMIFGLTGCKKKIADITIDKVTQELSESVKKYDEVYGFHEGLSKVCKNDKYGFIDKLGVEIIPCRYENASDFQYGVSIVK